MTSKAWRILKTKLNSGFHVRIPDAGEPIESYVTCAIVTNTQVGYLVRYRRPSRSAERHVGAGESAIFGCETMNPGR